nr:MAG TPA: hypothetical protein [Caudoviricetes sp.]
MAKRESEGTRIQPNVIPHPPKFLFPLNPLLQIQKEGGHPCAQNIDRQDDAGHSPH